MSHPPGFGHSATTISSSSLGLWLGWSMRRLSSRRVQVNTHPRCRWGWTARGWRRRRIWSPWCREFIERFLSVKISQRKWCLWLLRRNLSWWICNKTGKATTTQKKIYSTPSSEFKLCDRGLKKLASEAYLYVSTLKKTSYKDVATRLIAKLSS